MHLLHPTHAVDALAFVSPSQGTLKISAPERMPFDLSIRKRNAADAALFADFLARTFVLEPALRATCRDLLDHPWLNP